MNTSKWISFLTVSLLFGACGSDEIKPKPEWTKDQSVELNREWSQDERYHIEKFLERRPDWKMTETGTGLMYMIYQDSDGEQAVAGKKAKVEYSITLLDGTLCYSSDSTGAETFLIDRSEVESGLQEGIKYMRVGSRAKLIIPSHLAHGLIGDQDKIPPLETVIFDIHLLDLK
jgi:FKBP-type peptidyl-prolyl cis-trans isomerase FkpA